MAKARRSPATQEASVHNFQGHLCQPSACPPLFSWVDSWRSCSRQIAKWCCSTWVATPRAAMSASDEDVLVDKAASRALVDAVDAIAGARHHLTRLVLPSVFLARWPLAAIAHVAAKEGDLTAQAAFHFPVESVNGAATTKSGARDEDPLPLRKRNIRRSTSLSPKPEAPDRTVGSSSRFGLSFHRSVRRHRGPDRPRAD